MTKNIKDLTKDELAQGLEFYFSKESNDIVNSISHDIKNPLGIIDLSLGLLEDKIEPVLENLDPKVSEKIKSFIANINASITRCEVILENTQLICSLKINDEYKEVKLHNFFEEFCIFSKPSFKRSKVSLENTIDVDLLASINLQLYSKALMLFLNITFEKIKADKNLFSKVSFQNNELILETTPMNQEDKIQFNSEDSINYLILQSKFKKICELAKMSYRCEASDFKYTSVLSWPKQ